jgi:hypothetical protein
MNDTNIQFTEQEMALLHKGLKYNLHTKCKNWLENLALEVEAAISQLPTSDQDVYRKLIAERVSNLHQNNHPPTQKAQHEVNTIKSIRSKLQRNNATVTRADKGNTLVILPTQQYDSKIHNFIESNNFKITPTDPTKTYQALVWKTMNTSKTLIITPRHQIETRKHESVSTHHQGFD